LLALEAVAALIGDALELSASLHVAAEEEEVADHEGLP
jgi:hypothetical protein